MINMSESILYAMTNTVSIFIEASPFLLLGSILSSLIEIFVPEGFFERHNPDNRILSLIYGLFMGILLPTCECGIIPIVKKLSAKGISTRTVIVFLLSAPVINPLVVFSTYMAFRGDLFFVLSRIGIVSFIAVLVAIFFADDERLVEDKNNNDKCSCSHCGHDHNHDHKNKKNISFFIQHSKDEFFDAARYLIAGAVFAGFFKAFFPVFLIKYFTGNLVLSVIFMMISAFVLSVCSEADAFVANSFTYFPWISRMAFITFGPQMDIKLMLMYKGAFKNRISFRLVFLITFFNFVVNIAFFYASGVFL